MNFISSLISAAAVICLSVKYSDIPANQVPFGAYLAAISSAALFIASQTKSK